MERGVLELKRRQQWAVGGLFGCGGVKCGVAGWWAATLLMVLVKWVAGTGSPSHPWSLLWVVRWSGDGKRSGSSVAELWKFWNFKIWILTSPLWFKNWVSKCLVSKLIGRPSIFKSKLGITGCWWIPYPTVHTERHHRDQDIWRVCGQSDKKSCDCITKHGCSKVKR